MTSGQFISTFSVSVGGTIGRTPPVLAVKADLKNKWWQFCVGFAIAKLNLRFRQLNEWRKTVSDIDDLNAAANKLDTSVVNFKARAAKVQSPNLAPATQSMTAAATILDGIFPDAPPATTDTPPASTETSLPQP